MRRVHHYIVSVDTMFKQNGRSVWVATRRQDDEPTLNGGLKNWPPQIDVQAFNLMTGIERKERGPWIRR